MANLIRRAAEKIRAQNARISAIHKREKEGEAEALGSGLALGGAAAAAAIDKKWGEGGVHKIADTVPTNAAVGLAALGAGLFVKKLPYRKPIAMAGLGFACGALYRYAYDNLDFSE